MSVVNISQEPEKKLPVIGRPKKYFPKVASTITKEVFENDVRSIVDEMKTMLDTDLVKQPSAG